jgi:hypothetical protein
MRVSAITALFALALIVIVVAHVDISPQRELLGDAVFRDAVRHPPAQDRFDDPAPFTLWLPSDWFVWDSVRAGHLPLWDRMQGGGYSPLVTFQNGVLHPLRWIVAIFPRDAAPSALIVLAVFLAFLGTFLFCERELGLGVIASLTGAFAFAIGAGFMSFAEHSGALLPLAHLPWLLLLVRRSRVGLAVVIGLVFLAGHPALIFTTLGAAAVYAILETKSVKPLLSGIAGALLGAVALFPALAARPETWTYKTATYEGASYWPLTMQQWWWTMGAALIDRRPPGGCCADHAAFFSYVGLAGAALAAVTFAAALVQRKYFAIVILVAGSFFLMIPGPWLLGVCEMPPLRFLKAWYVAGATGFFFACAVAIGFEELARRGKRWHAIAVLLAVVMVIDYGWRAWPILAPHRLEPIPMSRTLAFLRAHGNDRFTGLFGRTHLANMSRVTGIEDVRENAPIFLQRYLAWWSLVDPRVRSRTYPTTRVTDRLQSPLVGDFNVRYVLENRYPSGNFHQTNWGGARDSALSPFVAAYPIVFETPFLLIHERPAPRPRAHFAERVIAVPDLNEAMGVLRSHPDACVIERRAAVPSVARGTAAVSYPSDSSAVLDTTSDTGGIVVLHDTFASGWTATIDGKPAEVFPVNVLSRGVVVGRGAHRIRMTYMPPGLAAGAATSAATLLVLIVIIIARRR